MALHGIEDLQTISDIVKGGTNLVLGELDRVEQKIYERFNKVDKFLNRYLEGIQICIAEICSNLLCNQQADI